MYHWLPLKAKILRLKHFTSHKSDSWLLLIQCFIELQPQSWQRGHAHWQLHRRLQKRIMLGWDKENIKIWWMIWQYNKMWMKGYQINVRRFCLAFFRKYSFIILARLFETGIQKCSWSSKCTILRSTVSKIVFTSFSYILVTNNMWLRNFVYQYWNDDVNVFSFILYMYM